MKSRWKHDDKRRSGGVDEAKVMIIAAIMASNDDDDDCGNYTVKKKMAQSTGKRKMTTKKNIQLLDSDNFRLTMISRVVRSPSPERCHCSTSFELSLQGEDWISDSLTARLPHVFPHQSSALWRSLLSIKYSNQDKISLERSRFAPFLDSPAIPHSSSSTIAVSRTQTAADSSSHFWWLWRAA